MPASSFHSNGMPRPSSSTEAVPSGSIVTTMRVA